jgi:predicted HAD superfamily Cof-like phosphohydrolase
MRVYTTHHEDLLDFHNAFQVKTVWKDDLLINPEVLQFRVDLIDEEVNKELLPAVEKFKEHSSLENLAEVADGLVDAVYVLLGMAVALELPWQELWNEVQRSNMAKVQPDGSVKRRADGKILKPDTWTPPDIFSVLMVWREERMTDAHPELKPQYKRD